MKKRWRQGVLLLLLGVNLLTLLTDWKVLPGLTSRRGLLILTGNLSLSLLILGLYFVSVVFYNKAKKVFFITGLCSLSMLFALEFSRFEEYGRFSNAAVGVYLGLISMLLCLAGYVLLLRKSFSADEETTKNTERDR